MGRKELNPNLGGSQALEKSSDFAKQRQRPRSGLATAPEWGRHGAGSPQRRSEDGGRLEEDSREAAGVGERTHGGLPLCFLCTVLEEYTDFKICSGRRQSID